MSFGEYEMNHMSYIFKNYFLNLEPTFFSTTFNLPNRQIKQKQQAEKYWDNCDLDLIGPKIKL